MSEQLQTSNCTIEFETYIDLALDDKIPWEEFVVQLKSFTKTYFHSQKLVSVLLSYLKKSKKKFISKNKHPQDYKIDIESVTNCKDTVMKVEQAGVTKLKIEPIEENDHDFVFENEFIKKEKIPKLEILDVDVVESKPLLDVMQQSKDSLVGQDANKVVLLSCSLCGESFQSDTEMYNHKAKVHLLKNHKQTFRPNVRKTEQFEPAKNNQGVYECRIDKCERDFNNVAKYHSHRYGVHKIVQCGGCGKTFENSNELRSHLQTDHNLYNYKCNYCNQSFNYEAALKRHVGREHGIIQKAKIANAPEEVCKDCGKCFSQKYNFDRHRVVVHQQVLVFKCVKCNEGFSNKTSLVIHRRNSKTCHFNSKP